MSLTIETERSLSIVTRDEMEVPIETDRNFTSYQKKKETVHTKGKTYQKETGFHHLQAYALDGLVMK